MIVFGTRMYGRCDKIPGMFHVGTQFFHIYFVPLIPYQSWIVISEQGSQFRGLKIPMSGKSILCGWGRAITLIATIIFGVKAMIEFSEGRGQATDWAVSLTGMILCACAFGFLMWHRACTHANFSRATRMAQQLGLSEAGHGHIRQVYGQAAGRGFEVIAPNPHQAAGFDVDKPSWHR